VSFEAEARWGVGNEEQIAAALLNERGKPTVEAACGGGIRESYFTIIVEIADNSIEFWRFGHLDSSCPGRVYDGEEWESRHRKVKTLRSDDLFLHRGERELR
jgi:hypothetical protein